MVNFPVHDRVRANPTDGDNFCMQGRTWVSEFFKRDVVGFRDVGEECGDFIVERSRGFIYLLVHMPVGKFFRVHEGHRAQPGSNSCRRDIRF